MKKVLIPNRGAIALELIYSFKKKGFETILLHSPEDALSLPVKVADKSCKFLSSKLSDSYMDIDEIIEKAQEFGAEYIHPGYGFLSESAEFAKKCEDNKIKFVGPDYKTLATVSDKPVLKDTAETAGIPVLPHSSRLSSPLDFDKVSETFKFPVIIKPVMGVGGRSIRTAESKKELEMKLGELFKREENRINGLFCEEYMGEARNVEVPFARDKEGKVIIWPEIESSIQRRFQKLIHESPAPISDNLRSSLIDYTKLMIEKLDYVGFGYTEFLIVDNKPYFSELNPTLQVNTLMPEVHSDIDLVHLQLDLSEGGLLKDDGVKQSEKHQILVTLMAEDPYKDFIPCSGTITEFYHYSSQNEIFKSYMNTGSKISSLYSPMIGKLMTYGENREETLQKMRAFLDHLFIRGVQTNLNFLKTIFANREFIENNITIDFVSSKHDFLKYNKSEEEIAIAAALLAAEFHIENRQENYKEQLSRMKQPGIIKRLFNRM